MNRRVLGSLQVVAAATCWSFSGVLCKWLAWNSLTIHGLRALFAALFLALLRRKWIVPLTKGTVLGAVGVTMNALLYIAAAKLAGAANAIVLQYAMPAFVILMCWIFYRQRPSRRNLVTAACVLLGVTLCSWEGLQRGNGLGTLCGLLSAVAWALVFFCSRMPGANASDYSYLGCVFGIPFALSALGDPAMSADLAQWLAILGMAACLAMGYFFIAKGMTNTSPITAAILSNVEPILNPFWVFVFLGERPGALTILGACVVLAAATAYSILGAKED